MLCKCGDDSYWHTMDEPHGCLHEDEHGHCACERFESEGF